MLTINKNKRVRIIVLSMALSLTGCATTIPSLVADKKEKAALSQQLENQDRQLDKVLLKQAHTLALIEQQPALVTKQTSEIQHLNSRLEHVQTKLKQQQETALIAKQDVPIDADASEESLIDQETTTLPEANAKKTIGSEERVFLNNTPVSLKARIDTGAVTSSLNAINIVEFERDGEKWVRFNLVVADSPTDSDTKEDAYTIESKVLRSILIRQVNTQEAVRRLIVELPVQLGDITQLSEFTLADRSHMIFPILLGRSFLKDIVMVDVSQTYTTQLPPIASNTK